MSADTSAAQPNQKYNVSDLRIDLGERRLKRVTPTAYKTADAAIGSTTPGSNVHARSSSLVLCGPAIRTSCAVTVEPSTITITSTSTKFFMRSDHTRRMHRGSHRLSNHHQQ